MHTWSRHQTVQYVNKLDSTFVNASASLGKGNHPQTETSLEFPKAPTQPNNLWRNLLSLLNNLQESQADRPNQQNAWLNPLTPSKLILAGNKSSATMKKGPCSFLIKTGGYSTLFWPLSQNKYSTIWHCSSFHLSQQASDSFALKLYTCFPFRWVHRCSSCWKFIYCNFLVPFKYFFSLWKWEKVRKLWGVVVRVQDSKAKGCRFMSHWKFLILFNWNNFYGSQRFIGTLATSKKPKKK